MPPTRRRALVADDDLVSRTFVSEVLTDAGFEVHTASDGRLALDVFLTHAPFALLVIDIMMPNMGGLQVVDLLARSSADLRVLFTSADDVVPILGPGRRFLQKPFSEKALLTEAGKLLGEQLIAQ